SVAFFSSLKSLTCFCVFCAWRAAISFLEYAGRKKHRQSEAIPMAKAAWTITPSVVRRAVEAVRKAGVPVARVEFDLANRKFVVIAGLPAEPTADNATNEWDEVLKDDKDRAEIP